jgi:hypothetical protein
VSCGADLVLPALVGVLFHGTWTALVAAEVAIMGLPDDCVHRALASSSIAWLLASFALTTVLQCVVAAVSMRGARACLPACLHCAVTCCAAAGCDWAHADGCTDPSAQRAG